jgi:hypothetical protein
MQEHAFDIIVGLSSCLTTLAGAYVVVGHKLSFIQGQLSQLIKADQKSDQNAKDISALKDNYKRSQEKNAQDLRAAFGKIKTLENQIMPTGENGPL